MTDRLAEIRRDLANIPRGWFGGLDYPEEIAPCVAAMPALLELAEAVMRWWEASGRATEAFVDGVQFEECDRLERISEVAWDKMCAAMVAFAEKGADDASKG